MFEFQIVKQQKHWWNGIWGRLARRDVYLYTDGDRWLVEARDGGAEGRRRRSEYADETAALAAVRQCLVGPGHWRELP